MARDRLLKPGHILELGRYWRGDLQAGVDRKRHAPLTQLASDRHTRAVLQQHIYQCQIWGAFIEPLESVGRFAERPGNGKPGFLKRGFERQSDESLIFENEAAATIHVMLQRDPHHT
jgi:hypothetical protein